MLDEGDTMAGHNPANTDTPPQPAAPPAPARAPLPAAPPRPLVAGMLRQAPAWMVSMLVHVVVLLSMALIVQEPPKGEAPRTIVSSAQDVQEDFEEFAEDLPQQPLETPNLPTTDEVVMADTAVENVQIVSTAADVDAASVSVEFSDFGTATAPAQDLLASIGAVGVQAGGLSGRSDPKMRTQLVKKGGGSEQSETAVETALKWFINHQLPDGSWSLDFQRCPSCQGKCSQSGSNAKKYPTVGPTALALLPFLGKGYTHKQGPYKPQVEAALNVLASKVVQGKGDAGEGMYAQGLVGICLSEAFALTQDKRLAGPAQLSLNYIMAAQDMTRGGWGYTYRNAGTSDTSILGWNLMAMKSGHLASLSINPLNVKKAVEFLDSVQSAEGSAYGYRVAGDRPANSPTTAVGLLCRMYSGWKKDRPALNVGLDRLVKAGPGKNLYYDYYATQVLHHVEDERWESWNPKMRDLLLKTQRTSGHEKGSWYEEMDGEGHGSKTAGRIYSTSLATMILEVYYRHLPIYGQQSVDEEFKE